MLLRDFQMHPWKQQVLHIDFQRIDPTTRLRMKVPLHFGGEENSPAVKTDKCLISHVANDVEIECLATQLPEFIAVDLSALVKGQSLHVSDIEAARPACAVVRHGTLNPVIVAVTLPKIEEEEAPGAEAAAGVPVRRRPPAPRRCQPRLPRLRQRPRQPRARPLRRQGRQEEEVIARMRSARIPHQRPPDGGRFVLSRPR